MDELEIRSDDLIESQPSEDDNKFQKKRIVDRMSKPKVLQELEQLSKKKTLNRLPSITQKKHTFNVDDAELAKIFENEILKIPEEPQSQEQVPVKLVLTSDSKWKNKETTDN